MQLIASKTYFFYGNRNSPWWKWKGEQKYEDPRSSEKRFTFADVTDLRTGLSKKNPLYLLDHYMTGSLES